MTISARCEAAQAGSMSSSAAHLARTSAPPIPEQLALTGIAPGSGGKPFDWLANADRIGACLNAALLSEFEAMTGSSQRWKHTVTPAGHSWSVLIPPERRTKGKGSGSSLPTLRASDGDKGGRGDLLQALRGNPSPSGHFRLPTCTVADARNSRNATAGRKPGSKHHAGVTLCDWWRMATPTARDWRSGK